jgi:hypothetical protein
VRWGLHFGGCNSGRLTGEGGGGSARWPWWLACGSRRSGATMQSPWLRRLGRRRPVIEEASQRWMEDDIGALLGLSLRWMATQGGL